MARLEDLLKAQGFTDADLEAVKPLLGDAKFRGAVEQSISGLETKVQELDTSLASYKTENEGWAKYNEEHVKPTLSLYEKEKADAVAQAASLEARLKLAEANGYAPRREETTAATTATTTTAATETFDPKKHNLPTWDDINKLANAEGQAIAMSANLVEEYRYLTGGKSIFDHQYTTQDGRTLNGVIALREEAMAAKAPNLYDFAAKKFDFAGKRAAIASAEKQKQEDAIRADERAKVTSQYVNPNTRQWMPSKDPFIPAPREAGKMPWDVPQQERRASRLDRAMQTQIKGAVQ